MKKTKGRKFCAIVFIGILALGIFGGCQIIDGTERFGKISTFEAEGK